MIEQMLQEKQIQPASGRKEGSILFIAGSPGTGKNWVVNNLTDIKNRYKVFDIDDMKELLSIRRSSSLEKSFIDYINTRHDIDNVIKSTIIDDVNNYGFWSQLVARIHDYDVIHEFLVDSGLFSNKIRKFLSSISNVLPNVAFNSTMQNMMFVEQIIDVFEEIGYDIKKTEVLWVVAPKEKVDTDIEKRNKVRKTDMSYVHTVRGRVTQNMLDILQRKSRVGKLVSNVYVVVNDRDNVVYYDDTSVVKDFKYFKVKLSDKPKVVNLMRKLLRGRYV